MVLMRSELGNSWVRKEYSSMSREVVLIKETVIFAGVSWNICSISTETKILRYYVSQQCMENKLLKRSTALVSNFSMFFSILLVLTLRRCQIVEIK